MARRGRGGGVVPGEPHRIRHPRHAERADPSAPRLRGARRRPARAGAEVLREGRRRGRVVWATGAAGLEELSAGRTRSVGTGVKGQAALLDLDMRDSPQLFVDGIHIVPHADGTTAIGSTTEREYATPRPPMRNSTP